MWIYKITNIQNNKVYIGQTIRPVQQRFNRHINDSINNIIDTHFARAIRKWGKDNFKIEVIDTATTQSELNLKEQYWINYYNSVNTGYNETEALSKCGGNTYRSKTESELNVIKNKIRNTKIGSKNKMSKKVKRINILTGKIDIFDTIIECAKNCGIKHGKTSITTRLNKSIIIPYKGIWNFEYYNEESVSTNPDECRDVE